MLQAGFKNPHALVEFVNGQYPIVAVDEPNDRVTVARNLQGLLAPTDTFDIVGSTGNNGTWTVGTIEFSADQTVIELIPAEDLPDATPDGMVQLAAVPKANITRIEERNGTWFLFYW